MTRAEPPASEKWFLRVLSYAFASYATQVLRLNLRPSLTHQRKVNRLTVSSCLLLHTLQLDWTYLFTYYFARFCAARRRIPRITRGEKETKQNKNKSRSFRAFPPLISPLWQRFSVAFTTASATLFRRHLPPLRRRFSAVYTTASTPVLCRFLHCL